MADAKSLKHLPATAMSFTAEHHRTVWLAKAPQGVVIDDLLRPEFWAHHIMRLKPDDEIIVIAADRSWRAELWVVDRAVGFAKCRLLGKWEYSAEATGKADAQAKAEVEAMASKKDWPCIDFTKATQWRVLGFDGNEVKRDLLTKPEAEIELEKYKARAKAA